MISSPANRTALREEENRPASQAVIASAVTGPTPCSQAARIFAPLRCAAVAASWCRSSSMYPSRQASRVQGGGHLQLPGWRRGARGPGRPARPMRPRGRGHGPPAPPDGTAPRGCAGSTRCARPADRSIPPRRPAGHPESRPPSPEPRTSRRTGWIVAAAEPVIHSAARREGRRGGQPGELTTDQAARQNTGAPGCAASAARPGGPGSRPEARQPGGCSRNRPSPRRT